MARPSPVQPAARDRDESPRAKRSKTSRQQLGRDARTVVATPAARHRCRRSVRRSRGRRWCRPGCACGRWRAGWPAPGAAGRRRRSRSTGSSGRSSRQMWSGPAARASLTASTTSAGQVHRLVGRAAGRRPAGPAAAGPRPGRHPGRLGLDPAQRVRTSAGTGRARGGSARRSRGSRPAVYAARGWRRRRTGGPASRSPAGRSARPSTWSSIRLRAAPTWPTSVRGSVSASGTRSARAHLAAVQRELGHPARGGGDPAQRAQGSRTISSAGDAGQQQAARRPRRRDQRQPGAPSRVRRSAAAR